MKYLLDTDHLVILQRRSEPEWTNLHQRMAQCDAREFALSLPSLHEQMMGAHNYIARAKDAVSTVRGYQMLEESFIDFGRWHVFTFDEPAARTFDAMRKQKVRIGKMDLRIAAVAISQGLTLLTRNSVHFAQVPGLQFEDWTVSNG